MSDRNNFREEGFILFIGSEVSALCNREGMAEQNSHIMAACTEGFLLFSL
jgi:hypothetical protein